MKIIKALLTALAIAILAIAVAPPAQTVADGSWEEVCCGSGCELGDYCIGNGPYTCCKD